MRIVGLGLDLLETDRVARALAEIGDGYADTWLSPGERARWTRRGGSARALAAIVSAKEACLKGLGGGRDGAIQRHEVEVRWKDGAPVLVLSGEAARAARERGVGKVHVSLTSSRKHAAAAVVLERAATTREEER